MVVGCVFFAVIGFIVLFSLGSSGSKLQSGLGGSLKTATQTRDYDWLARKGVVAQGILLQVSATRLKATSATGLNLETREVVIDIEVPGDPPYQLRTSPMIPTHLDGDILPGATVELRVDPGDPTQVMIFGPGVGLPLAPFTQAPSVPAKKGPTPQLSTGSMAAPARTVDVGMDKCASCGAMVNTALMQSKNRFCPVCGARQS